MGANGRLNRRQRQFVAALVGAPTIEAAAKAAGIGEATAYRYLKDPAVKQALGQALDDSLGQVSRRTVDEMGAALGTLAAIHRDPKTPPAQRVSAARAILDAGPKLREAFDLAARVAALEERQREKDEREAKKNGSKGNAGRDRESGAGKGGDPAAMEPTGQGGADPGD